MMFIFRESFGWVTWIWLFAPRGGGVNALLADLEASLNLRVTLCVPWTESKRNTQLWLYFLPWCWRLSCWCTRERTTWVRPDRFSLTCFIALSFWHLQNSFELDKWRSLERLSLEDANPELQLERTSWAHLMDGYEYLPSLVRWLLHWECHEPPDAWGQYVLTSLICQDVRPLSWVLKDLSCQQIARPLKESLRVRAHNSASADECDTLAWVRLVKVRLTENIVINEPLVDLLVFWHPAQSESEEVARIRKMNRIETLRIWSW